MSPYSNLNYSFFFIFLIFLGGLVACNYTDQGEKRSEDLVRRDIASNEIMNEHDGAFLMQCGSSSLKVMEMTKLGTERAVDNNLRAFAMEIMDVHRELYDQASSLGREKSVSIPVVMLESDKIEVKNFSALADADFDKQFCNLLLREQTYMVEAARRFSEDAADTDVRAYARNYAHRVSEIIERLSKYTQDVNS